MLSAWRLFPLQAPPTMIQEGVKDCSTSSNVAVLRSTEPDTAFQNHPLGGVVPLSPTAALLLVLTDCCNLVAVSWSGHYTDSYSNNPFSRGQWHRGQQLGTEFKLTVQFLCLESQCMNSLPAGMFQLAQGEQAQICCLSSRNLNSFSFTSTQKNTLWWKPMLLSYAN